MTTYGSLFSGAGGFELGLNQLNWECKWMCEKDKYASSVLQYHWPKVPLYEDVKKLDGKKLDPVDVIVGGFPCQDLSNAGLKSGFSGTNSSLFYDFVRIVKEMREETNNEYPKAVIWENVPGILNKKKDWINSVYTAWSEIGAVVQEHRLVDAKYFGVAQRRKRVIGVVVFDPRAERRPEILLEPEAGFGNFRKIGEKGEGFAGAFKGSSKSSIGPVLPIDTTQISYPDNRANPDYDDPCFTLSATAHHPKIAYSITPLSGQGADLAAKETETANTITAVDAPDRGTKVIDFIPESAGTILAKDAKGVREPEKLIFPERGVVRKFTEVELERLMGWPDNHTANGGDGKKISMTQRRKMCGNGLVAPVAYWAGRRLSKVL
jgi:DNA (cytosine-5)-methyltransferase 1